jgi:hypothetical protein
MNGKTAKLVRRFQSLLRGSPEKVPMRFKVKKMVMHGSHRERGKTRKAMRRMLEKADA